MLDKGFYNMDCMQGMKKFPDKFFNLAIVDPPYGGGAARTGGNSSGWNACNHDGKIKQWDIAPSQDYFEELFRVSENQIIWGGNYFYLPPTRCFIIWRKPTVAENFSLAMCEYAWTSFNKNAKWIEMNPQDVARIHHCQKPIALYTWLLNNYAKTGDKILDTHVGSASSLIACHRMGFDYWGFELDKEYFDAASERLEREKSQPTIFEATEHVKQLGLEVDA